MKTEEYEILKSEASLEWLVCVLDDNGITATPIASFKTIEEAEEYISLPKVIH